MEELAKSMHKEVKKEKTNWKECSTSLVITRVEIKTIFQLADEQRFFFLKINYNQYWLGIQERELPHSADERVTEEKLSNASPN